MSVTSPPRLLLVLGDNRAFQRDGEASDSVGWSDTDDAGALGQHRVVPVHGRLVHDGGYLDNQEDQLVTQRGMNTRDRLTGTVFRDHMQPGGFSRAQKPRSCSPWESLLCVWFAVINSCD